MSAKRPEGGWEALIGWFLHNQLVVFLLVLLFAGAGLAVAPFDWHIPLLPRHPVPVDAIPDVGDNQQIVFTEWSGRSARDVEDQVSYPLTSALLGMPGVRTVRSTSALGFSMIFVIFEDDVEVYWSRSRVLEKLASLPAGALPDGVVPTLGPDATALGQVFWYTLEGHNPAGEVAGGWGLDELRSIQDWTVRYALQAVPGVAEVASIGGFVKEYQVDVDPDALRAHGVTLPEVAAAVRGANLDVGARTLEVNGVESLIRGLGFIRSIEDLESAVVVMRGDTPIQIRDLATVQFGPALRVGALDDAGAPAVGGVVVARFGENPLEVIQRVKAKIAEIQAGLPNKILSDGTSSRVAIVPFYDRTTLIHETLNTLSAALTQQLLITMVVVLVLLGNLRSSLLISATLPLGVLVAFVLMKFAGVDANIMALGGIAIAIGTMVDIGIVFVENINQHLEDQPEDSRSSDGQRLAVIRRATAEVAPAVLTSVLTTTVSFLPVFGLTSAEYKLFAPLALTKTFAMAGALVLALLVLPGLCSIVLRRRPVAPPTEGENVVGWPRLRRSIWRAVHLRDWLVLGLGLWLITLSIPLGLLVLGLAVFRLARPLLAPATVLRATTIENLVVAVGVGIALALAWRPLGVEAGGIANTVFVGVIVAGLLLGFKLFERAYPRLLRLVLEHKVAFLTVPAAVIALGLLTWLGFPRLFGWLPAGLATTAPISAIAHTFPGFGREYMPPFDEGAFLYMPTTMPHASIGEVAELVGEMDRRIAAIPEVDRVVGKLGRAESAIDPAPISMVETVVTYHPEYRIEPDGSRTRQWRDHIHSTQDIWNEVAAAAEQPGFTGAPKLMPINARIVMLQSGMRAPMGVKVAGPDLESIERFGLGLESLLRGVPGIRAEAVFAERVVGSPYIEIHFDREALARYGLSIVDAQEVLEIAVGGIPQTRTVEGRERYAVRVRYQRERRDSVEALREVLLSASNGAQIPLAAVARIESVRGPQMIRSEDSFLVGYVLFDREPDVAEVNAVEAARDAIAAAIATGELEVPAGVSYRFAGSYESQIRSEQRLLILVPLALVVVFMLLYLQFHDSTVSAIIASGVAVAVAGGFLLVWLYAQPWFLNFEVFDTPMRGLFQVGTVNLSVAVWIGVIALVGIATDDGVVLSTYLTQRFRDAPPMSLAEVRERTLEAGVRRVRPCLMTTATTILALLPVISSRGRGADVMMPLALPAVGGMLIELITLFVVPVLFCALQERRLTRSGTHSSEP